ESGTPYVYIEPLLSIQGKANHLKLDDLKKVETYIDKLLAEAGTELGEPVYVDNDDDDDDNEILPNFN
ncbi:hypothetical protein LCGC14_2996050, partial [marine sediment metagenome]